MAIQMMGRVFAAAFVVSLVTVVSGCGSTQTRAEDPAAGEVIRAEGVVMTVEGLGCPMCAESIKVVLDDVEGVTGSSVNLEAGTVDVSLAPGSSVTRGQLARAVTDGGFTFRGMRVKE